MKLSYRGRMLAELMTPAGAASGRLLLKLVPVLCLAGGMVLAQQKTTSRATGEEAGGLRHAQLRCVSTSGPFGNVNRNDARAALKVLYDLLAQKQGFLLDSSVDVFDSLAGVRARLQSHSTEVIMTDLGEFLELENSGLVTPVLTDARAGQVGARYPYVLLVNPASRVTTVAGLRGKSILVTSRGGSGTGAAWLDVFLDKGKLGRLATFFASVQFPDRAQACVLSLFFNKVDACVVDEVNLNLAREMNPQLGRLIVLARSRPMIESVIAVPVERRPFQKELIDAMLTLQEEPRGRQLLMVFKTDRLVRIQPGDLDSGRELWRDYNRLVGITSHRPAGSVGVAEINRADRTKAKD